MKIWSALAPRSVDTISTIARKQATLLHCDNRSPFKPRLYPCTNMQKDMEGGISGIMTEIAAEDTLMGLDCVTENLFGGVSVVRCNITRAEAGLVMYDRERLQLSLAAALSSSRSSKPPPVAQLLPSGAVSDFFWHDQVCELKGGTTLRNAILQDGRKQNVNFYDAYACVCRKTRSQGDDLCDTFMRDGAPWVPTLSGSVGLYEHQDGDAGVYLVCCSSMPAVGSELVRALKADLMHRVSAQEFCQSKEMWFLQNINRRNRLRLILDVAACLKIAVPSTVDIYAHPDDSRRRVAAECCGVCTEFFDSVAVLERNENQTLAVHEFAKDTREIKVVRHFKGCVDLSQHAGAIPVHVSEARGLVVLSAGGNCRAGAGLANDTLAFSEAIGGAVGSHCLFPVINITEDRASHSAKIQQEIQTHAHFSLHDIVQHSIYAQTVLSSDIRRLADAHDACGHNLFFGVHYEPPLPTVVYPHTALRFVPARAGTCAAAVGLVAEPAAPPPRDTSEPLRTRARTLPECMCAPVTVAPGEGVLQFGIQEQARDDAIAMVWDQVAVSTLKTMTLGGGGRMQAAHLIPMLVHTLRV